MNVHNRCFCGEIRKNIMWLPTPFWSKDIIVPQYIVKTRICKGIYYYMVFLDFAVLKLVFQFFCYFNQHFVLYKCIFVHLISKFSSFFQYATALDEGCSQTKHFLIFLQKHTFCEALLINTLIFFFFFL